MAEDTAAALVIQLSADFKQFQKEMRSATGVFDTEGRKIERRQAQLRRNLENGFSGIGKYLVGGAALYGIERFVSSIVEAGGKIKDVGDATKIGTDEIQAWGLLAERAGTSQEDFNGALEKFSKNLGQASIQGGNAAKFYKELGISVKGDATAAFYQLADAVARVKDPQQRVALVTQVLGKNAAALTPILAQGSAALKAQTAQFVASGQVIKRDAIDKLDDLGDAWSDLKRQFTAISGNALAEPLSRITDALKDPAVQSSLRTFASVLADVAIAAAKVAKYAPAIAGIWAGAKVGRFFGPEGTAAGAIVGGSVGLAGSILAGQGPQTPNANAAPSSSAAPLGGGRDISDLLGADAQKQMQGRHQLEEMAQRDAAQTRDAILSANDDIRQSYDDEAAARRDSIKTQDDALLQLAQGTGDYYDLQKKVIEEVAKLDIQAVNERRDADLAAIKQRTIAEDQAAADELASRKRHLQEQIAADQITQHQADASLADLEKQQSSQRSARQEADAAKTVSIEQQTASQITAINAKKNADLKQADEDYYQTKQNLIQLNDAVRQGLIDIGTAGLHGFGSLKDAASQALDQIAQMILQMYVLKPLVEGLFGKMGTTGGGLLGGILGDGSSGSGLVHGESGGTPLNVWGSILGSIWPFAKGGVMTPNGPMKLRKFAAGGISNGIGIFGEAGPEAAVPLPDGRRIPVDLRVPPAPVLPQISAGTTVVQNIDLRGAIVDKDVWAQVNQISQQNAQQAVAIYDRKVLPGRVQTLNKFPRRMH
jgi:hypothetical protein